MRIWLRDATKHVTVPNNGTPATRDLLWRAWVNRELPVYIVGAPREAAYDQEAQMIVHVPKDGISKRTPCGTPVGHALPVSECDLSLTPENFPIVPAKLRDAAASNILKQPPETAKELLADISNLDQNFVDEYMSLAATHDGDLHKWAAGVTFPVECWTLEMLAVRMIPKASGSTNVWVGQIVSWLESRPATEDWDMWTLASCIHLADKHSISKSSIYSEISRHRKQLRG